MSEGAVNILDVKYSYSGEQFGDVVKLQVCILRDPGMPLPGKCVRETFARVKRGRSLKCL